MTYWLIIVGWGLGWFLLWHLPGLRTSSRPTPGASPLSGDHDDGPAPHTVSVIIPARNEAERLPVLLAALAAQDLPPDQVIVVDDNSTDDTAAVAASFAGVEVVGVPPVPEGWAGKPWACASGAQDARGEVLVFLDADVDLDPSALRALLDTWSTAGGLVSVLPNHHTVRPVEALSLPFNVISAMGLGVGAVVRPTEEWGAAGPCMMTALRDYERVGGHTSVAGEVAEDLALAQHYRAAGMPITCRAGQGIVRYRMYRDLAGLVEGWSKNVVIGARRAPLVLSVLVATWVTALLAVGLRLLDGPTAVGPVDWIAMYGAVAAQLAVLGRRVGRFGPAALVWPVLMVFFVAVFALSAVRTLLLREVGWSGRRIAVAGRR